MSSRPRIKPSQVTMLVGIALALITIGSGVVATVAGTHQPEEVGRAVFGNIPSALRAVFYTVLPVLFLAGGYLFSLRVKNWERGQPDNRATTTKNVRRRVRDFRAGVYMQTLLRDPAAGLMHSFLYFGFIFLFICTVILETDHQMPKSLKFLHGDVYRAYAAFGDLVGVMFLIGVLWAIGRRYGQRPYRIRTKTKPEDAVILGTFLLLGVTGFLAEGLRIALVGRPSFEKFSFVGYPLSYVFRNGGHLAGWHQAVWITHVLGFCTFLLILPITKLRHMFTSPINMYLRD